MVLAASIDLHIDSRGKFLCNASREHLVKLSNCSWQLWFWPKDTKTEVTHLIPEWGSELLSFKGLLCCFPFSLSPLCSVLFCSVCLFVCFLSRFFYWFSPRSSVDWSVIYVWDVAAITMVVCCQFLRCLDDPRASDVADLI